jgi:hypothetical protein
MRISFDIDDTLVCRGLPLSVESGYLPRFVLQRLCEPLRGGTRALVNELRRRGCSVWIYTTSGRTPFQIQLWLFLHGIRVDGIVNDERHRHELSGRRFLRLPSKYPLAFGIDLHVDDSEGVRMEGDDHGFRVVVVRPEDQHWAEKILQAVAEVDMMPRCSAEPAVF